MTALEWDKTVIMTQTGDDLELAGEILTLFKDSAAADLQKIRDGLAARKPGAVAEAAHSIKGAAASLGIEGLCRVAYQVEEAGRQKDLQKVAEGIAELESLVREVESSSI